MATNSSYCDFCDNLQINEHSVVWCPECDEGPNEECKNHNSDSKASKSHETVSITEYKKIPTEVINIVQTCKLHNEKFELFCRDHDCPCCQKCVNSHIDCKSLTDINELTKNINTSNSFYEFEQTLLEVVDNVKQLGINRKENLKSLENKKKEIEAVIKQTRKNINDHLDRLQDDLIKELKTVEQNESRKIEKLLTTLKRKEKEINKVLHNFACIKQHASELQIFLTMKDIEKDIAVEEKFIQSVTSGESTKHVNISFQITRSLQQIYAGVQKFGEIIVSFIQSDFSIQKRKDRQAQIMVALPTKNINNMTLTFRKRISTKLTSIYGCSLLPRDRMVFSCNKQNKIRVLKSDGSKDFEKKNDGDTLDVVFIGGDSIAVTYRYSRHLNINIIDLKKHKLKKSINLHAYFVAVVYKDGHLMYSDWTNGIKMINLNDETITNIGSTILTDLAYVTTFGDRLIYTNFKNHSVTCCDYHSNILWEFCERSVLRNPQGISVDNDGNVYVAGHDTDNVVVISTNGQCYRQLKLREDGLISPSAVHYDTSNNKLLVASVFGEAFLYDFK